MMPSIPEPTACPFQGDTIGSIIISAYTIARYREIAACEDAVVRPPAAARQSKNALNRKLNPNHQSPGLGPMSVPGPTRTSGCAIGKSALPPSTDMRRLLRHVRFVPTGDIARALLWPIF